MLCVLAGSCYLFSELNKYRCFIFSFRSKVYKEKDKYKIRTIIDRSGDLKNICFVKTSNKRWAVLHTLKNIQTTKSLYDI